MSVSKDMAKMIDMKEDGDMEPISSKESELHDLYDDIEKMTADRDAKVKAAKEQLVEMLEVTADKYRTGTGIMEALRVLRMISDGRPEDMQVYDEIEFAVGLAFKMVKETSRLAERAGKLGWSQMDTLLNGAYDENFIERKEFSAVDLAFELMRLDLCRNVGPAAEDIASFVERTEDEMKKVAARIDELERKK